jgi:putative addiction module component (TIGR02574 family)
MSRSRVDVEREALALPPDERLEVATALLESLERDPEPPRLPDWQRTLLDERIAEDDAGGDSDQPWEDVKRRILADF